MNIRHYINLIEVNNQTTYFHGSKTLLNIGMIMTGRKIQHTDAESKIVEKILEQHRPFGELSRDSSVFMVNQLDITVIEKAGGYADYIFSMLPQGPVSRNDAGWWAEIYSYSFEYMDAVDHDSQLKIAHDCKPFADSYWAGKSSDQVSWEYRTPKAQVISWVGGYQYGEE